MPGHAESQFNRGNALAALKQFEEALASYDTAIRNRPDYAEAYCNRGLTLAELGQQNAAIASVDRAIAINPNLAQAHSNRGNFLMALGQWSSALASFDRAIALKPSYIEAHYNRGNALLALSKPADALACYEAVIGLQADHAQAFCSRGLAQEELKQWDAALASFDRAIAIKADFAHAHSNRGAVLMALERSEDALASLDRAIAIDPDLAEAHSNRGNVLTALDRWDEAQWSYERAVAIKADFADAHFNMACLKLLRGDFEGGWVDYEWRRRRGGANAQQSSLPGCPQPLWTGRESLSGKTILLYGEQGLGDTIQFCRYASLVAAAGARVILAVPGPLIRMLSTLQSVAQIISQDGPLPEVDYHCPLLSLPLAFRTRLTTIPQPTKYLSAPELAVESWRARLGEKNGLRVGLVWSGNRSHKNDHHRSIALSELLAALPPQCEYISLQKDLCESDLKTLNSHPGVLNFAHELQDFRDTAALCECMDIVVSVDTSVAHLSAALGSNTWILLPRNPDWRWLLNRRDSPWYSTVTLYRQGTGGWSEVLKRVRADLVEAAVRPPPRRPQPKTAARAGPLPVAALLRQALALHQRGQLTQAQSNYEAILALQPQHFDALNMLGVIALQKGAPMAALALFGKAIEADPQSAVGHFNRGTAQQQLNQAQNALASYDRALAIKPDYAESHCNRGLMLSKLRQWDAALASYDRALVIKPDFAQALFNRGVVLEALERWQEALNGYEQAVLLEPGLAEGHCNQGRVLAQLDRWEPALASYDKAIAIQPQFAEAHFNRGLVLSKLLQAEAALASFDRSIALRADFPEAHYNRGLVLANLKQVDEALASYDKAISLRPGYVEAHQNRSWMLLLTGELARGWIDYEWRWKEPDGTDIRHKRNFRRPLWTGEESIAGKTILLHAEQGLGDTIQFSRYAKRVAALGARVILEVQRALAPLLERLHGVSGLIMQGSALPDFDIQCPLLSLPLSFKTALDSIPSVAGDLEADSSKVAHWREVLGEKRLPRVGLVWSGSPLHKNDQNRSIPVSEMIGHLPEGFQYVCLQKDLRENDRQALKSSPGILTFVDGLNDFSDTAALCACMDIIVSVDTSVAHLAGALGLETWILLPYHADWRWLLNREDSPWYPSVRLYRQDNAGEWQGVLARLRADLLRR
jgi:tetratricopeptide (TPR) repeat protein